jgi:hypothetical protein
MGRYVSGENDVSVGVRVKTSSRNSDQASGYRLRGDHTCTFDFKRLLASSITVNSIICFVAMTNVKKTGDERWRKRRGPGGMQWDR